MSITMVILIFGLVTLLLTRIQAAKTDTSLKSGEQSSAKVKGHDAAFNLDVFDSDVFKLERVASAEQLKQVSAKTGWCTKHSIHAFQYFLTCELYTLTKKKSKRGKGKRKPSYLLSFGKFDHKEGFYEFAHNTNSHLSIRKLLEVCPEISFLLDSYNVKSLDSYAARGGHVDMTDDEIASMALEIADRCIDAMPEDQRRTDEEIKIIVQSCIDSLNEAENVRVARLDAEGYEVLDFEDTSAYSGIEANTQLERAV